MLRDFHIRLEIFHQEVTFQQHIHDNQVLCCNTASTTARLTLVMTVSAITFFVSCARARHFLCRYIAVLNCVQETCTSLTETRATFWYKTTCTSFLSLSPALVYRVIGWRWCTWEARLRQLVKERSENGKCSGAWWEGRGRRQWTHARQPQPLQEPLAVTVPLRVDMVQ